MFSFRNDPGYWSLDDVAVEAAIAGVPELNPAGAATPFVFMALGLCLANSRRRSLTPA